MLPCDCGQILAGCQSPFPEGAARGCAEPFGALTVTKVESKNLDGTPVMLCFFGKSVIKIRLDSLIQHVNYVKFFVTKLQKHHR